MAAPLLCSAVPFVGAQQTSPHTPASPAASIPAPHTPVQVLSPNSVSGTVTDPDGRAVAGAQITLQVPVVRNGRAATADGDGWFSFAGVMPGPFHLQVSAPGFASRTLTGTLRAGDILQLPPLVLAVAGVDITVEAVFSPEQLAEQQVHAEEKQRLIGVLPNFYVSYDPNAVALSTRQKFSLAFKNAADPGNLFLVATVAGVQQASNGFSGYGQGAQGYGKRYGADLANLWVGTYMGGAVLPWIFHQDPRYFYKGTGRARSRAAYALSRVVICRGDNGRWQPNYSGVLGDLSAGAISNIYYPASDRQGALLTFENGLLAIAGDAMNNLVQEFVLVHFTTKKPKSAGTHR